MLRAAPLLVAALLLSPLVLAQTLELGKPVVMRAAAVSETSRGLVGATATITITSAANGSGHVFLDTFPLTEVDMQGSARLAARVAAQVSGKDLHAHDFFFVVRSGSHQIGGPSAGGTMAVGAVASLNGWNVRDDVLLTGTINPDGTVGPVGGIAEKATAAASIGVARFLFPAGQEVVPFGERIVNVTQYCRDELRIECHAVADVIDAIGFMTDHVIERPPLRGNVTGDDYLARLAPLGGELVDDAAALVEEARVALEAAPPSASRTGLAERQASATQLLERAREAVANGTYYTAASLSFQASINARYVREASEYLSASADGRAGAVAASLAESRAVVDRVRRDVERSPVQDTNGFEAVGAAQVRLLEAERRLLQAETLWRQPRTGQDIFDALYQAAFAAERAETAAWWLKLTEGFPKGLTVEADALEETARDTITTSTEEIAYVQAVFASAGAANALDRSRELLDEANEAMARGFYAAAMLNALEASVRASVTLEIAGFGGNVPESKLETARENAARAIQGARARGVESLLAQSAYEFGLSLDEPAERLSFLGVARVTGNLAGLPGLFNEARPPESRFQGNPGPPRVEAVYVAAAFAVGIALGVGAGLTAMMPRKPDDDAPRGETAPET
ncbi:MAG TPA: S16 family serine protease [Candidatus Thermoplasmatota archaeon]|nr:S16 family serine protease [Candidatus Thermoplasmatota archaeon]